MNNFTLDLFSRSSPQKLLVSCSRTQTFLSLESESPMLRSADISHPT